MELPIHHLPNSRARIEERLQTGHLAWTWPLIIVLARLILAFAAQGIVAAIYLLMDHPTPWIAAAPWWVVYGTLIDAGCLFLLWQLAKREGIRVRDLISLEGHRASHFILQLLGFLVLFVLLFLGGGMIFGPLIYNGTPPTPYGSLPLWGALYSFLVWPFIWGIAEELTYMGYALPRLEVLTKKSWLAIAIVCFGWSIQHIALPFAHDWQWIIYRFASTLPIAIVLPIVYLRTRRLLPFIIVHCLINATGTFTMVFIPLI